MFHTVHIKQEQTVHKQRRCTDRENRKYIKDTFLVKNVRFSNFSMQICISELEANNNNILSINSADVQKDR